MDIFPNRFDKRYRKILLAALQLNGKKGLINTALKIDRATDLGLEYKKVCKIDLCGIAATTLFDRSGEYNKGNIPIASQLYNVFKNVNKLNEKGIKLRLRLLFLYPYSEFAITRIQAEKSMNRSSMNKKRFTRGFEFAEEIIPNEFASSTLFRQQTHSLKIIQDYIKEFDLLNDNNPNEINIRFTPFGLNSCIFFINNSLFFDSYTLAKENNFDPFLIPISPVTSIDGSLQSDKKIYSGHEDHFRYLWELDSTMFCEDITYFDRSTFAKLDQIKKPVNVTFEQKAERIKKNVAGNQWSPEKLERIVDDWKFTMNVRLQKLSVNLKEVPSKENLFIACSWPRKHNNRKDAPNNYAKKLKEWLDLDFGRNSNPCMNVEYVQTDAGDLLHKNIYNSLERATLAIILLTKDIESNDHAFYSRPNLYHELGYLTKQFGESKRLLVFYENGVSDVSNMNHIAVEKFYSSNFDQAYLDTVIPWLQKSGCYISGHTFNEAIARQFQLVDERLKEKRIVPQ
jgi:hypothetical protein